MAPIKISYVVSFSSQDPRYPAENLLSEDGIRPWLGCPKKHSRQLSVELQLERASPIGYIDIGNYGCAFLQIEVGRSSWTCDQPYLTLVPTVTLMTPADSKLDQNRYGVRMFKEDFLELTVGQKWDRVRLTCSQPFSPCSRFGLSFIRLRTPQEQEPDPPRPPLDAEDAELSDRPCCSSPAFDQTSFPEPCLRSREEQQLRSCLGKLEGAAWSRSARMVLLAARNQALRPRAGTSTLEAHPEPLNKDGGGPAVPGSALDVFAVPPSTCRQLERHCAPSPGGRAPAATSRTPRVKGRARGPRERRVRRSDRGQASNDGETGVCPICSGCFLLDLLPTHASQCGEDPTTACPFLSPDAWVSCPICQLPFSMAEVEQHASNCGETPGALSSPQGLE
ncbi:protein XNDC1N isoform X2 [Oenanthe melanoleuca]|uniref:protein XNDC1N isoform X2 n=1 Tax=Oenanthe melanoleuca TaxID=2939378 RepID=UPI0024C1D7B5|nr:protein XNDC1N isoform X2 [Oenanthe melanoleuca]XP_056359296.1 protein XNDC1N isoform X2 [Oenanthe melanoleuca]XP_056359306.1 protein XNDC1N isoform X2 [Oenanthe melanoleuca]